MEDVCDNLFNKDPFLQQGGDMVRVGGFSYACMRPKAKWAAGFRSMRLTGSGEPIEAARPMWSAAGLRSTRGSKDPPIYDLMENYITKKSVVSLPDAAAVKVIR
jgi:sulfur-oxidizing protein SoxB